MFGRKKLKREKAALEAELRVAEATIHKLKRRLRQAQGRTGKKQPLRAGYKYIVHDEYKFIYAWIHKVACSSVKAALLPFFDLDPTPFEFDRKDGTRYFRVHDVFNASDHQIGKDRLVERLDGEYRDYFKFGFVRNPWDRLLSCYSDKIVRKRVPPYILRSGARAGVEFYANMPFAKFVEAVCETPDETADGHFRPQHLTICGPDGRPMTDFVGRFENLQEDFARMAQHIGEPKLGLPERNRAEASQKDAHHYRDYYDERLKRLVYRRYEKDVEMFDYSF